MPLVGETCRVTAEEWRGTDIAVETEWLGGRTAGGAMGGFDHEGWESSIWILHSMYELLRLDVGYTHEDPPQAGIASGLEQPHIIGDLELSEVSAVTGGHLGLSGPPADDWRRPRSAELARRQSVECGGCEFPPRFQWFPYRNWPASIDPPPEGSLDEESLWGTQVSGPKELIDALVGNTELETFEWERPAW